MIYLFGLMLGTRLVGLLIRIVYDSGIGIDAKLADVLQNGNWIWPPARSKALVNIQSQLPGITIGADDVPVWK
jgi:hypothetical protein